jgi:hypothetical protein
MQDSADSDLRQNVRRILGISVQDDADFDMLISNDGYTAQTIDIHPISFQSETTFPICNRNPCFNHINALSLDGKSIS